jgi:hypothetical protein
MSSACSFFISYIPLTRSGIGIVFCFCLSSWITALILSSSLSHRWTCGSSSNLVQSCACFIEQVSGCADLLLYLLQLCCCFLLPFLLHCWWRGWYEMLSEILNLLLVLLDCLHNLINIFRYCKFIPLWCLEASQKFLLLFVPVRSCVLFPPEFWTWPAHRIFPMPLASLLLTVIRLSLCVHETVPHGRR